MKKGGSTALFHACQERVVRDVGNIDQLNSPAIFDGQPARALLSAEL